MGDVKKICIVVSSAEKTMRCFLLDHIKALSYEYQVFASANTNDFSFIEKLDRPIKTIPNKIERKISPWKDIGALLHLLSVFFRYRFDAVHSVSPKAGLVTMLAGVVTGVPVRIHTFTGQVWVTRKGAGRLILKNIDRLIALMATDVLVDSPSQLDFLVHEKIVSSEKSMVLAEGSIAGVDTQRFSNSFAARRSLREELDISDLGIVFLFLGRLTYDKGIIDLLKAFSQIYKLRNNIYLLIVGSDEEGIYEVIKKSYEKCLNSIRIIGQTDAPEQYMAASDVLCLPSYREGFGNVIIESASVGIPAIGSKIYGVTDAIQEGVTGLLHEPGNEDALLKAMITLVDNPDLREEMGRNAHERAVSVFSTERLTSALVNHYKKLV